MSNATTSSVGRTGTFVVDGLSEIKNITNDAQVYDVDDHPMVSFRPTYFCVSEDELRTIPGSWRTNAYPFYGYE